MALDIRLACLRDAIRKNWADLETQEVNGTLVVRLKKGVAVIEPQKEREPRKRNRQAELSAPE
ncbi:TPA: hypothetical protein HA225_04395 [Candidatus Micrarchaeota archaeon]|nr:hypothetical protein [Candidatus Micrarchaeota archaeon]HIH30412.1 hypothetical protein [Candidatus Micrarchaeota archaeon]